MKNTQRTLPPDFDPGQDILLDPRKLRGLAHPLRLRLRSELVEHGPATATQLAARLGLSSGITSYHLRQLAAYGFIADDPDHGHGPERYWRALHRSAAVDPLLIAGAGGGVGGAYLRAVAHISAERLLRFAEAVDAGPRALGPDWTGAWDMSNWTVLVTPAEAAELSLRIHALVAPFAAGTRRTRSDLRAAAVQVQIMPEVTGDA